MEVAHFLTGRTVAFVDAGGLCRAVVDRGKLELDLVLYVATMAGSGVGFDIGHVEKMTLCGIRTVNQKADEPNLYSKCCVSEQLCRVRGCVRQQRSRRLELALNSLSDAGDTLPIC
jgi:hypothetical protein